MAKEGHEILGATTPPPPATQRVITRAAVTCLILGLMSFTGAAALYWDGRDPAHLSMDRARETLSDDASSERRSNAASRIQELGLQGIAALKKSAIAGDDRASTMIDSLHEATSEAVQAIRKPK